MTKPTFAACDLARDERNRRGEILVQTLVPLFARMRRQLECDDAAAALATGRALATDLARLAGLVAGDLLAKTPAPPHLPPLPSTPDPLALQDFRRGASRAFDHFRARLAELAAGPWRSKADDAIARDVRRLRLRHGLLLAVIALAAGLWFFTQRVRIDAQQALVERAKRDTVQNALRFVSLAAWQAQATSGQPLGELVRDMSADCAGIDVNASLPNHPCREAWAHNREALFTRFIPPPGDTKYAPGEIYFDPWGGPYVVLVPAGQPPRIVSAGPTGRLGDPGNLSVAVPYWDVSGKPAAETANDHDSARR